MSGGSRNDSISVSGVFGQGCGNYILDLQFHTGADVYIDGAGRPHAIPVGSYFVAYTHDWNGCWKSCIVYSQVNVCNKDGLAIADYHEGEYFSANLGREWAVQGLDPTDKNTKPAAAFLGVEYIYAMRETFIGKRGEDSRIQLTAGVKY